LQAGGRRFDPVWLHQIGGRRALIHCYVELLLRALLLSSVLCVLPFWATRGSSRRVDFAPGRVRSAGCVLSDIVKRRSLRVLFWMKIQDGAQSPCTRAWVRHRKMARPRTVQICRLAPDRAAVGTISKQAGLSKFQVSGVGCRQSETIAGCRYKSGMN
jgi:hypothetical protein